MSLGNNKLFFGSLTRILSLYNIMTVRSKQQETVFESAGWKNFPRSLIKVVVVVVVAVVLDPARQTV